MNSRILSVTLLLTLGALLLIINMSVYLKKNLNTSEASEFPSDTLLLQTGYYCRQVIIIVHKNIFSFNSHPQ